ncbi:MAG: hypothetical protein JO354_03085 [Verrucomicrobia bacterium]|nr:hypothetical protein [Verrucomicrobiota bacterium]
MFNSTPTNTNYILGRYAYAIYDEGGLIDMNVAGYPSNSDATTVSHKGVLAFANLQAPAVNISAGGVDDVVGWRNYATAQPAGTFASFNFDTTAAGRYIAGVLSTTNGFVTVAPGTWNNGTNQAFTSRQNLLNFRSSSGFTANALQYLGTFSRDTNIPTLPSSLAMRVTSTFTRRDGTQAQVGELLLRRFPISELGWIGPGGVVAPGTAATVQRDFGLVWNVDHWDYDGPAGISPAPAIQSPLLTTRDPNFFELLAFAEASTDIRAILSLGASIIDQYDSDSITTQIAYFDTASSTVMRAYGVETVPAPPPAPPPPPGAVVINRAFHTVGEFGYAYKTSVATLNFYTVAPNDGAVLDLFTVTPATVYSGVINLNTRNYPALAAALNGALRREGSSAKVNGPNSTKAATDFANAAALLQALGRQDIPRLTASVTHSALGNSEEEQELVARSLGEITQVRTWNLMIDVIAQSGRYPPNAGSGPNTSNPLANFVVEGEKRYWLHIAIDRFTGEVIDQQLEAVYE